MTTGKITQPYTPTFGNGVPGPGVFPAMPYFDISVTPINKYVHFNGAWLAVGGGVGINASTIQGVAMKAGAPGANTKLTYVLANNDWEGV